MKDWTDGQLMEAVKRNDNDAFHEIFLRYRKDVTRMVRRKVIRYQDVEDLTQEIFLAAYRSAHAFDVSKVGTLGGWFRGITMHHVDNWLRKRIRIVSHETSFEALGIDERRRFDPPDPRTIKPSTEDELHTDMIPAALSAMSGLTPKLREAIELTFFQGKHVEEVANTLGLTPTAIFWRRLQAIRFLRGALGVTECKYVPSQRMRWAFKRNRNIDKIREQDRNHKRELARLRRESAYAFVASADSAIGKASRATVNAFKKKPIASVGLNGTQRQGEV